jgi:hypothetical protein
MQQMTSEDGQGDWQGMKALCALCKVLCIYGMQGGHGDGLGGVHGDVLGGGPGDGQGGEKDGGLGDE